MDRESDDKSSVSEVDHDEMFKKIGEFDQPPISKPKRAKRKKVESAAEFNEIQAEGEFNAGMLTCACVSPLVV